MYVTKEELSSNIYPEIVAMIESGNGNTVDTHINTALKTVSSKLGKYYQIDEEFQKTGDARNSLLVNAIKDIAIYHLYSAAESITNLRVKRYEQAIDFLKEVQEQKTVLWGVPLRVDSVNSQDFFSQFQVGSTKQRPNELL
jgi:phage gp36-like protein